MKKSRKNRIICPCCGNEIDAGSLPTKNTTLYAYKVCDRCGRPFSAIPEHSGTFEIIHKMIGYSEWVSNTVVLAVLIASYYTSVDLFVFSVVFMLAYVIFAVIFEISLGLYNRKRLEKMNNGFLPIAANNEKTTKVITYKKGCYREYEHNSPIKENICVMLPSPDVKIEVDPHADKMSAGALELNNIYRMSCGGKDKYMILCDVENAGGKYSLLFGSFNDDKIPDNENIVISTLENEDIACIMPGKISYV